MQVADRIPCRYDYMAEQGWGFVWRDRLNRDVGVSLVCRKMGAQLFGGGGLALPCSSRLIGFGRWSGPPSADG
jgi:hypothetical protein